MNNSNVQEAINRIVDQIVEKYNPTKIILFGSAAQNQTDEINDVDFMIIKEEAPHYGVDRIRELYTLIESDIAVDYLVVTYHKYTNVLFLDYFSILWHGSNQGGCSCQEKVHII